MKVYFAALVLFLFAFAGLATGLLLKRKGLRGGCRPAPGIGRDCHCQAEEDPGIQAGTERHPQEDEDHACAGCPSPSSLGAAPKSSAGSRFVSSADKQTGFMEERS